MSLNHIPILVWGQNIACFLLMSFILCLIITRKFNMNRSKYEKFILPFAIFLLSLTFLNPDMEGVHRWISIGFIKINAAMIAIPLTLIELWKALKTKSLFFCSLIAIGIIMILFFQPDASQLTGFAIPMMIMLCQKAKSRSKSLLIIIVFSLFVILSWMCLDKLPPVSHVERIIYMVAEMGFIWLILGVISLLILPLPFILFPPKNSESISKYIGFYYIIIILSTFFGSFPVPLMGYGISPIIGFYISLMWYLNSTYCDLPAKLVSSEK